MTDRSPADPLAEPTPGLNGAGDRTLLIVDDDRPFRERLAKAMERRGFRVAAAEGVTESIEMARETNNSDT